jgi:hypothetical protein
VTGIGLRSISIPTRSAKYTAPPRKRLLTAASERPTLPRHHGHGVRHDVASRDASTCAVRARLDEAHAPRRAGHCGRRDVPARQDFVHGRAKQTPIKTRQHRVIFSCFFLVDVEELQSQCLPGGRDFRFPKTCKDRAKTGFSKYRAAPKRGARPVSGGSLVQHHQGDPSKDRRTAQDDAQGDRLTDEQDAPYGGNHRHA